MSEAIHAFLNGQAVSAPFDIDTDKGMFHCRKILRVLAGRRLVVEAEHQGKRLLLKMFAPTRKGKRELSREITGYQACKKAGVPIPEQRLIEHNLAGCLAVGYEFLSDATTFKLTEHDALSAERLVKLMLLCHQGGIYQQDIHPDNLLATPQGFVLIDLASVRGKAGKPLSKQKSLTNLALLVAQFPPEQQVIVKDKLSVYFQQRGWSFDQKAQHNFKKRLNQQWQKRKNTYLKKCFRSCTMTAYKKTAMIEYAFKRPFFEVISEDVVHQIDALVEQGQVLKAGNSATVVVTKLAGQDVVIKRYNVKSFSHFLKRCWRPSRAANSWRYGSLLELLGISTPQVLGFIEQRFGVLRRKAFLITEFSQNADELSSTFVKREPERAELKQLRTLFQLLGQFRLSHGDMKASNLLLTSDKKIELIDLDAMQECQTRYLFLRAQKRDKKRFLQNWSQDSEIRKVLENCLAD